MPRLGEVKLDAFWDLYGVVREDVNDAPVPGPSERVVRRAALATQSEKPNIKILEL